MDPPPAAHVVGGGFHCGAVLEVPTKAEPSQAARRDRWTAWLRTMLLREHQLRETLESHRRRVPSSLLTRYEALLGLSEARLRTLEDALKLRGQKLAGLPLAGVRAAGRLAGALTQWGGARRILSMDLDGVRGLEKSYFEAFHDDPPPDISSALCGFIAQLESERSGLVAEVEPLFVK